MGSGFNEVWCLYDIQHTADRRPRTDETTQPPQTMVGYRLNFIDFDSDSAYRFRFFSIPSFDSNVIK